MADATSGIVNFNTPVILAFPQALFEAKKFKRNGKEQGDPKFGASFVMPPDHPDFKTLKDTALRLAKEKWPGRDIAADYKAKNFKMPWNQGNAQIEKRIAKLTKDGKQYDGKADFLKDQIIIKSSSKFAPRYAIIQNNKISDDLEGPALAVHKGKFYFGVQVLAQLNVVPYDAVGEDGKDGVTVYINLVCSLGTGKRLSGGQTAAEAFSGYVGKPSNEDPTGDDLEDDISF